jgi:hypothetical protein
VVLTVSKTGAGMHLLSSYLEEVICSLHKVHEVKTLRSVRLSVLRNGFRLNLLLASTLKINSILFCQAGVAQ